VGIGLISYPLYLWHWPLLSFTHIVQMEKPSSTLRFMVLVLSFLLAWMTYFFIERNLRYRKHWLVPAVLLVSLLIVGFLGYQIFTNKGYPERIAQIVKAPEDIGLKPWEENGWVKQDACLKKFGNFEFCILEDNSTPVTAMLIGDSHANHLYPGLVQKSLLTGGNLLNLGMGGCLGFVNAHHDVIVNQEKHCQSFMDSALNFAITSSSIKTVFLAGQWGGYLKIKKRIFRNMFGEKIPDKVVNFEESLRDTLKALSDANKEIIFVMDVPNLDFNLNSCIERPWRITGGLVKTPCAVSRVKVNSDIRQYRAIVAKILIDYPKVKIIDPIDIFCDDQYCWASLDRKMLYRDGNHLNWYGSIFLSERIKMQ